MKEKIQQRFNFKVRWQAGNKMLISDALSRSPVEESMDVSEVEILTKFPNLTMFPSTPTEKLIVNAIMGDDVEKVFGDQKLNNLLQKANQDPDYVALRDVVNRGFPPKRNMLPEKLKDFQGLQR